MLLLKLAWKNVWRNRHRSIITMSAIFCAVVLAVITTSLQDGVFDNLVRNVVSFNTGYLQIHRNGYWDEQILDNSMIVSESFEDSVLRQEGISQITSRLESFILAASEDITRGCLVSGIDPDKEDIITALEDKVISGRYLDDGDDGVLVGEGLAQDLALAVGDSLIMIGQGYHGAMAVGRFPIRGILHFGSPELSSMAVFMTLEAAQDFFGAYGAITTYVVSIDEQGHLDEIAERLEAGVSADYEVMTWEELVPEIAQHIKTDKASMVIIIGILYILISFGIFGTVLMMMVERKYELGMLVAIGMTKIRLIGAVFIESVITVFLGCLAGLLASIPVVFYLNRNPIRFKGDVAEAYEQFGFEAIFPTSTEAVHFWSQALVVLVIGLVLSLYPAINILRIDPTRAMSRR